MILTTINQPSDLKNLSIQELTQLAQEIREVLIAKVSTHGGHFGPNLGVVEATIALHYVFDSPTDKFVFDVSHQCYPHKMLTGRKEAFLDPAHYDDVSGYTAPSESEHDHFVVGHTSTSLSLALGLAQGRDLTQSPGFIVGFIGDASLGGGEALEALNSIPELAQNIMVIVNDNQMSIAENHGALYTHLHDLRENHGQTPNMFTYLGYEYHQVDGHDLGALIEVFTHAKQTKQPVLVHMITVKGKGYKPAEQDPEPYHWTMPFDATKALDNFQRETLRVVRGSSRQTLKDINEATSYGEILQTFVQNSIQTDPRFVALTSGTPAVYGFSPQERKAFGKQFIDVGIAEENAVAVASGIARAGAKPLYTVYSTFMQRTYDQIAQDVCLNQSPVLMVVMGASANSMNDATHIGFYDIPMLTSIPGLMYLAPRSKEELIAMLRWGSSQTTSPVAIRLPQGPLLSDACATAFDEAHPTHAEYIQRGDDIALISVGHCITRAQTAAKLIAKRLGHSATLINARCVSELDTQVLDELSENHKVILTLEDGALEGGYGEHVARYYASSALKVHVAAIPKGSYDRYNPKDLYKQAGLDPEDLAARACELLG